jgi:hypothetical protein
MSPALAEKLTKAIGEFKATFTAKDEEKDGI